VNDAAYRRAIECAAVIENETGAVEQDAITVIAAMFSCDPARVLRDIEARASETRAELKRAAQEAAHEDRDCGGLSLGRCPICLAHDRERQQDAALDAADRRDNERQWGGR